SKGGGDASASLTAIARTVTAPLIDFIRSVRSSLRSRRPTPTPRGKPGSTNSAAGNVSAIGPLSRPDLCLRINTWSRPMARSVAVKKGGGGRTHAPAGPPQAGPAAPPRQRLTAPPSPPHAGLTPGVG